ncbi:MAG: hypothetical protein SFT93_03960 [Rickettsiaceae bacterium]|nr:hypothetical protein [Rickettsiaceae bacterium]
MTKKGCGNDKGCSGNDNSEGLCYCVIQVSFTCHPRENGDPGNIMLLDSRLRGNDKKRMRE